MPRNDAQEALIEALEPVELVTQPQAHVCVGGGGNLLVADTARAFSTSSKPASIFLRSSWVRWPAVVFVWEKAMETTCLGCGGRCGRRGTEVVVLLFYKGSEVRLLGKHGGQLDN
jgi:hypothetical protein